jgi:cyclase
MQPIAPNIFIATSYPPITVGAVLTREGWVIIDTPPMPSDAQMWRRELAQISNQPIQYLISTDAQRERILGNAWFEAPLIAQEAAVQQLLTLKTTFLAQAADDLSSDNNELVAIASLRLILPQVSYVSSLTIHAGDTEISLLHRPGAYFGNS